MVIGFVFLALFLVLLFFQTQLPEWERQRFYRSLYVHARNGFYFTTLANRLVLRVWPTHPTTKQ